MLNSPCPLFLDCYLGVRGNSVKILWFPKHILRYFIDGCVLILPRKSNPDSLDYFGEQTQFVRIAEKSKPRLILESKPCMFRSLRKSNQGCPGCLGKQTQIAQTIWESKPRWIGSLAKANPNCPDGPKRHDQIL